MIKNKIRRLIDFAIQAAYKSPASQKHRVGCVIVKRSIPVGIGFNNMAKTHPRALGHKFPFVHAELASLIGVPIADLTGATAYVARIRKKTPTGLSKPCIGCENELRRCGIAGVYYTTDSDKIEHMLL